MYRLFKLTAAGLASALLLAAGTVAAQESRTGQAQVYRSVLASDVTTLLSGMGYTSVKKAEGGRFDVETRDGFKFSVELAVCDAENAPSGCLGVNFFASWTMEPGDEPKVRPAVDSFNSQYRIGKAMLIEDSVFAERYIITDGGVTLQHITDELEEFEAAMSDLGGMLQDAVGG